MCHRTLACCKDLSGGLITYSICNVLKPLHILKILSSCFMIILCFYMMKGHYCRICVIFIINSNSVYDEKNTPTVP